MHFISGVYCLLLYLMSPLFHARNYLLWMFWGSGTEFTTQRSDEEIDKVF